ncbi:class I SAM-dependent methyltransferase [Novosphingobium sp.]|uniref:class I SAM-dependent methyltransferase n=1 Tax=Novosphingobium sp. TaxID=1874826 RepID=UPI0035AEC4E0
MLPTVRQIYDRVRFARVSQFDLKAVNLRLVSRMKRQFDHDEAMERAIGGGFEEFGKIELAVLRQFGLEPDHSLIDVGCGAGRLARPLSEYLTGSYLGIDLVPDLIQHARKISARPDWRFEVIDHIGIPAPDNSADFVCFFSVLTHLLHEHSYWYLEEAKRVLKPGGRVVFSFLEVRNPLHQEVFWKTVRLAKARAVEPLNVFIERDAIEFWARSLEMELEHLVSGDQAIVAEGALGQSCAVLRKPGY